MVKSTGVIRKVDELGRVVLPVEVRQVLGIEETSGLEILVDEENEQVILRKATRICLKCRSTENLKKVVSGYYLCDNCIAELK